MTPIPAPGTHLEAHEVVAYLEGTLDAAARSRIEAHLSECEECTSELVAVGRLRRPAGHPGRWLGLAAAAAAVIAVVLVGPGSDHRTEEATPPVRGDSAAAAVAVVTPADGDTLRQPPTFTWRPVPGAAAYRISVSRADGDSVWAASLGDTSVRAPEGALVPGPAGYYWYVDVLLADGRSIAGTAHQFHLGP